MPVVFFFVSYLVLAFAIPLCWSLIPVWRRTRHPRNVGCPVIASQAEIRLDRWYAVKMHALGNREFRVKECSQWPERGGCPQECLVQIGVRG